MMLDWGSALVGAARQERVVAKTEAIGEEVAPLMLSVSGMRGIVGRSLTPETLCRFVGAAGAWMRECVPGEEAPGIVLACDGRRGGEALRRCVGWALVGAGFRVSDIGVAATPTVGVMVERLGAAGGLTLTASHNPGEWNGMKVITREGSAPDAESAGRIIARFWRAGPIGGFVGAEVFGSYERVEGAEEAHVGRALVALEEVCPLELIRARRFRVVVDSVNASGAGVAKRLLAALGCEVAHLNGEGSGVFAHAPEPTAENLAPMGVEVASRGGEVGFAQDPDADRLALLDEKGRYIGEEYTLALAALSLLGGGRGQAAHVAANLSTSRMIDDVAASVGARVHRSLVGEANVVSAMRACGADIGGEGNGGVIWPRVSWIRDSVGAMGLILALLAREGKPLSVVVSEMPAYAIEKRKVPVREGLTERALRAVEGAFRERGGVEIDTQDGVRGDFASASGKGRSWAHVRASNTEPIIRLIAEAPTGAEASAILDRLAATVAGA